MTMATTQVRRARISGTGMYVPDRVVTNDELASRMDTTDEWIQQRTGIVERRWITPGQTPADLAHAAAVAALEDAGIEASELDCILLATLSPEHHFPGTAFYLQDRLGASETPCIDLHAQCTGFLYALSFADSLVVSGKYERVLVVGAEVHSTGLDISTRGRDVSVIFGDGAGAVVVEANRDPDDPAAIVSIRLGAQGEHANRLCVDAPASSQDPRLTHEMIDDGRIFPHMDGRFVFKHAVRRMPGVLQQTLSEAGVKIDDVDLFLFHQANLRINEYVANQLQIPDSKTFNNIMRYGNCSAGSIPMLLAECTRQGRLEAGHVVSLTGFGSGFTWGSAVLRW
jgi:3-oxoacyl-[acyl-carrier-protein] synthase-3